MASLIPALGSATTVVLAATLLARLYRQPATSFIFLSLRTRDTTIALRVLLAGFVAQLMLRVVGILAPDAVRTASIVVGSVTTAAIFFALLVLNVAARGPSGRFYMLLPSYDVDRAAAWTARLSARTR